MIYVTLNFWDGSKVCCFKTRKSEVSTQVLPQVSTQVKPALGHIYVTGILSADYYYKKYSAYAKHWWKADPWIQFIK